jgi:UDP-N-acetylmuramoyl-L-alanine---L-glutamate ligase
VHSPKRQKLTPEDLSGLAVAIVGTGREGVSVARMLTAQGGVRLTAIIDAEGGPGEAWDREFGKTIPVHVFDGDTDLPDGINVAVMSPGIAPHRPLFQVLARSDIIMTSGTDLFMAVYGDRMIGITGSKGKSTTSALTAHIIAAHGEDVSWGGNVGIPLWDIRPAEIIVAELSSYQCSSLTSSPTVAVVTSLFEEHLDWHGSAEHYFADKLNLLSHIPQSVIVGGQSQILTQQMAVLYPDLPRTTIGQNSTWSVADIDGAWHITRNHEAVMACGELPLLGHHNWWNVAIALEAASTVTDIDNDTAIEALRSFHPLPHRLEPVDDPSGVLFINDSLATNPSAAAVALGSMRDRRVIVLLGGADRGVDRTPLRQELIAHPPAVIIGLPASGEELLRDIEHWCVEAGVTPPECVPASGMDEAIREARKRARAGDVVLMSPGAPSFGQYRDYEHRAEDFKRAIAATRP